jgi:hypothetical protein
MCGKIFRLPHLFDFHQEDHGSHNLVDEATTDQTSKSSHIVSVPSSAASHTSSETFVQERQPWDHFPPCPQQSRKAEDTSLFVNVHDVLWIDRVDATKQGVYGIRVLVRTIHDTVQLMPAVSFLTLLQEKEQVEGVMGNHAYEGALYMQETGRYMPLCPFWTHHLRLEDLVPEEVDRRLLESGEACPLTCLGTF